MARHMDDTMRVDEVAKEDDTCVIRTTKYPHVARASQGR